MFEKSRGEDGSEFNAFVLASSDGVHEAFPGAGIAPVDGGILVGREGHVEIEAETKEDEKKGYANGSPIG